MTDLAQGVRQEAVGLQEVKGAEGEQLEGDANVAVEVEAVQHLHAVADGKQEEKEEEEEKEEVILGESGRIKLDGHWSELTLHGRDLSP